MATILSIFVRSRLSPPSVARTCPSSDVPAPKGITGTACSLHTLRMAATSVSDSGYATRSGSAGGNGDSSWPW